MCVCRDTVIKDKNKNGSILMSQHRYWPCSVRPDAARARACAELQGSLQELAAVAPWLWGENTGSVKSGDSTPKEPSTPNPEQTQLPETTQKSCQEEA